MKHEASDASRITLSIPTPRLDEAMEKLKRAYGLTDSTGDAALTNAVLASLRDAAALDDLEPMQIRENVEAGVLKGYRLLDMIASIGSVALLGDLIDAAIESDPDGVLAGLRRGEVIFDATKGAN